MKYCIKCGQVLDDSSNFCFLCGYRQPAAAPYKIPFQESVGSLALVPVQAEIKSHRLKGEIPILIWSLILVPFLNVIGTPLAVIAAFFCLLADAQGGEEGYRKLDNALYLCIISTVFDIGTIIFFILKHFVFHL